MHGHNTYTDTLLIHPKLVLLCFYNLEILQIYLLFSFGCCFETGSVVLGQIGLELMRRWRLALNS